MTKKTPGIWIGCTALILGAIALAAVGHFHSAPYTIVVDGNPIVTVESRSTAKKVVADVRLLGTTIVSPSATRFVQSVTFHRAEKNAGVSDLPEAVRALEKAITIEAEGFAIIVNDEPVLALPKKSDADSTLELAKRFYERKVKTLYTGSTFKERVSVDKRYVEAEKLRATPEDAVSALTATSERPLTHVVQRGDRAVNIIRQYKISLADFKSLNPGIDPDKLTEGDVLTVRVPKLPITVVCKSLITETVNVTPPADVRYGPRTGTRTSKILVTYENGRRAGQEIVSQVTTWNRPAPRKYSRSKSKPVKSVSTPKPAEDGSGQNSSKPPE